MKPHLPYLMAFLLASFVQVTQAQQKKFIDSSAIWIERFTEHHEAGGSLITDRYTVYYIESDTVINQLRYGKIMTAGEYGQQEDNSQPPKLASYTITCRHSGCYVGAIRLDTAENQVIFWEKDEAQARVLYDFDSILYPGGALITNPDSFLFEGRYYKHWGGNHHFAYGISELTGSNNSILDPSRTSFEVEYRVECIHSPRLGLLSDYCNEKSSFLLSDKKVATPHLSVYPNPVKDGFTLQLPESGETRLIVLDATGKIIREEIRMLSENHHFVSCSELVPGVYILQVIQGQKRFQNVLVKE